MRTVGLKILKNQLSEYVRLVAAGEKRAAVIAPARRKINSRRFIR
jgi:antitoxin (DNA-binding transcriptional repressor) of toxin-antitoxin stability system